MEASEYSGHQSKQNLDQSAMGPYVPLIGSSHMAEFLM
jgi:hypothetical protein